MNITLMKGRRVLCVSLSLSLVFSSFPFQSAFAEGESVNSVTGSGGSISIYFEDDRGNTISKESLRPGMRVKMSAIAHNSAGATIPCDKPNFRAIQGVSGGQLGDIDSNGFMEVGNNFGTAEVAVQCNELPGVEGKTQVANVGGLMTPAEKQAAEQATADKAVANKAGGDAALAVLGGVVIVGGVVALVGLLTPKKWCGSWRCTTSQTCCNVYGGGQCSGTKEFSSESECKNYLGPVFGSSCKEC